MQEHIGYEQHKILLGRWPVTAGPLDLTEPFRMICAFRRHARTTH